MYELFIANKNYSSWSLRPWLLMQELAIPFTERMQHFLHEGTSASFRRFSPTGQVPCLHAGDFTVWDSLAIVEFLAERHGGVWPADPAARVWARCAAAEMHSGFGALRSTCGMNVGVRVRLHTVSPALQADLSRLDALWNEGLTLFGGPFLAGRAFTAVDAFFAPVLFRLQTYGLSVSPTARAYAERVLARPGMQRWQREALAERVRDAAHEAELAGVGVVTQDLRAPV
jgi:glutathione S-transferase